MDIHRCRFVPYQPRSINALAFSHHAPTVKSKSSTSVRLAVGRENGDIEIWNPSRGNWVQEKILRGSLNRTIDQLAWTQDLVIDEEKLEDPVSGNRRRLFSCGGSPAITEWDLSTGVQKRYAESNAGDVWCFAAQPQWRYRKGQDLIQLANAPSQLLAAGCSSGSIVLFTTSEDSLQYLRVLAQPRKKDKVICITWKNRETVVAGYENGEIRVINVPSHQILRTMTLGKGPDGTCVVWALKCLPDGTIVSGDSSGELRIWDASNYSLLQRLKSHEADILDIAVSTQGDLIFTTGVDRRTVVYRPVAQQGPKKGRWQEVEHRRYHQHDVKALASYESKDLSVVVSGGIDGTPIVLPLRNSGKEYHRSLPHLPQKAQMSCSPRARLLLTWWERELLLWHLPRRSCEVEEFHETSKSNRKLVARLHLDGDEHLTSAEISSSGSLLIAATSAGVRLFQLRQKVGHQALEVRLRPLELPWSVRKFGATSVGFSPDSKWLYALRRDNTIVLSKVLPGETAKHQPNIDKRLVRLVRKATDEAPKNELGDYHQCINTVAFSSDSRVLAVADLSGRIDVWLLEGHETMDERFGDANATAISDHDDSSSDANSDSDSASEDEMEAPVINGQRWLSNPSGPLPQLDSAVLTLSFKPHGSVSSASPAGLHPTRNNPHPISHEYPTIDTKLVAITSAHQLVEFDVLSAQLSDWSRRNPSVYLSAQFTNLKDRVMGCFWDIQNSEGRERLYMYGSSFLFMLDMSRDLSTISAQETIGRLGHHEVREALPEFVETNALTETGRRPKKRKRNTGAGDQMKDMEWQRGTKAATLQMPMQNELSNSKAATGLLSPVSGSEVDSDIDSDDAPNALVRLRRADTHNEADAPIELEAKQLNGRKSRNTMADSEAREVSQNDDEIKQYGKQTHSSHSDPPYFITFRYRSIFGAAVLSSNLDQDSNTIALGANQEPNAPRGTEQLEVIIVERPMYDVELVPRFDGGQDWGP